ncbi:MAG: radical SAM protein [Betaproteobacteria bacterium]|nr:radical SAM protein [Betaproteobacteria bacterium]
MLSAQTASPGEPVIVGNRVELQLFTTLKCNLKCSYCSLGVGKILRSQKHATYSAEQLETFISTHLDDKEVYITLYGGEPTLNIRFVLDLMDRLPNCRFNMQTNGTLLHRVPNKILARLSNIMISVDGGEEVTDGYRGKGVYRKVLDNAAAIRAKTPGTLTARVTWWSGETSFEELDDLTRVFDYVYFQFAHEKGAYTPGSVAKKKAVLARLIKKFFGTGSFYPIVPIMGTVRNMVLPSRINELSAGMSQCRVSTNLLNVMPDGKIYPCPDMLYEKELLQGDIAGNWVKKSPLQPHPDMPCRQCTAYHYCRGNCMKNMHLAYVKNDTDWRTQVTEPICDLIRFMGAEVDRHDPCRWYAKAPLPIRTRLANAEIYEFCEVMP